MPFHQLPLELLYAILSHLGAEDDHLSLRACASTCRALVSPAQAYFFRSVTLYSESPVLLAKLESRPHIRTFIKHLRLVEIHRPWIQRSEVLQRTLGLLSPYVVSLNILQRRRRPECPRFDFSSLSQLKFLEKISLREEDMRAVARLVRDNALPTFLNHFPKLRAITFDQCFVRNQNIDSKSDVAAPVFCLQSLDVCCCHDALVLDWLIPALSSLQRLRLWYPALDPSFHNTIEPQFTIAAGESLQHLEVRGLNYASNADFQSLMTAVGTHTTNLRSLSLMITGPTSEHSPIQVAVQSLLLICAHTHLQHLTIGFFQHDAAVDDSAWDDLQDLLLETRFPALRSVEVRLLLNSSESIPVPTEPFITAVPRLAQKRMIYVCHIYSP